jgi:hypothetical protein
MMIPSWVPGSVLKIGDWLVALLPSRPKLKLEIREVCFDARLASVDAEWAGYAVDMYIFFRLWVVNQKAVPTTAKAWTLTAKSKEAELPAAEVVPDINAWQYVTKKTVTRNGLTTIQNTSAPVTPFPLDAPLQHGIPVEGWVAFLLNRVKDTVVENSVLHLTLVDSFGKHHRAAAQASSRSGPNSTVVHPDAPF